MRAFGVTRLGSVDELKVLELDSPVLASEWDIIVQVKAVSLNPVDTKVRGRAIPASATDEQRKPSRNPLVLGYDAAGIVTQIGGNVRRFKVGDRVWYAGSINRQGSNSELHAVDSRIVGHMPSSVTFAQAASLPLVTLTAWEGLYHTMHLPLAYNDSKQIVPINTSSDKKRILVIGGAGGVGAIAIQLAKLSGLDVIATASRPASQEFCKSLGADLVIPHLPSALKAPAPAEYFVQELKNIGIEGGVDYVYDTQSTVNSTSGYFDASIEVLKPFGKMVYINGASGPVDVSKMFRKCLTLSFEFMFSRDAHTCEPEKQGEIMDATASLIDRGIVKIPILDESNVMKLTLENLKKAHSQLESLSTIGKVVLEF
ncbi:zinc-binding alcohol dehydrogenase family protein [Cladochytrium replicatum]|nr:zinc-binding alcohol dehydrogenase family protein [Cladochytrium replicatum]